jgi:hypothetical protein
MIVDGGVFKLGIISDNVFSIFVIVVVDGVLVFG